MKNTGIQFLRLLFAAALLLGAFPAWAAATLGIDSVTSTNSLTTALASYSWPHTNSSGPSRVLLVGVSSERSTGTEGVTNVYYVNAGVSNTLTFLKSATNSATASSAVSLWYLFNPPAGSNLIVVAQNGGGMVGGAISFTNLPTSASPLPRPSARR